MMTDSTQPGSNFSNDDNQVIIQSSQTAKRSKAALSCAPKNQQVKNKLGTFREVHFKTVEWESEPEEDEEMESEEEENVQDQIYQ